MLSMGEVDAVLETIPGWIASGFCEALRPVLQYKFGNMFRCKLDYISDGRAKPCVYIYHHHDDGLAEYIMFDDDGVVVHNGSKLVYCDPNFIDALVDATVKSLKSAAI